jgi:uncharacterized protein
MGLKEDLEVLYQLQLAESAQARAAQELAMLDDGRRAAHRAHQAKDAWEASVKAAEEGEGHLKDRELALGSTEAERADKWKKAYGGTISDPKELGALERKIAELDRHKGALESEILGLYEQVEARRQERDAAEVKARQAAVKAKQVRAQFKQRTEELQAEQASRSARIPALREQLPPALLQQYEQMKQRNQGVAVAPLTRGNCGYCSTRVAGNFAHQVQHAMALVRCDSCGCILVRPGE